MAEMAMHHFPVRSHARPAAGLAYVPPFASEQNQEFRVSLGELSGNWYSYPEDQRQMYGLGFVNPLNSTLFTVPVIGFNVTIKRAIIGVGGLVFVRWLMKP
jgi:hypothetical protein